MFFLSIWDCTLAKNALDNRPTIYKAQRRKTVRRQIWQKLQKFSRFILEWSIKEVAECKNGLAFWIITKKEDKIKGSRGHPSINQQ